MANNIQREQSTTSQTLRRGFHMISVAGYLAGEEEKEPNKQEKKKKGKRQVR